MFHFFTLRNAKWLSYNQLKTDIKGIELYQLAANFGSINLVLMYEIVMEHNQSNLLI
jgi:hypothetical protein